MSSYPSGNVHEIFRPYIALTGPVQASLLANWRETSAQKAQLQALKVLDYEIQNTKRWVELTCEGCVDTLADALGKSRAEVRQSVNADRAAFQQNRPLPGPAWLVAKPILEYGPSPDLATAATKAMSAQVDHQGKSVAAFWIPTLEAARQVGNAWGGKRPADQVLQQSLSSGAWKTVSLDPGRAKVIGDVLGAAADKVVSVWKEQKKLWDKGQKVSIPSAALSKAAKMPVVGGIKLPPPPVQVQGASDAPSLVPALGMILLAVGGMFAIGMYLAKSEQAVHHARNPGGKRQRERGTRKSKEDRWFRSSLEAAHAAELQESARLRRVAAKEAADVNQGSRDRYPELWQEMTSKRRAGPISAARLHIRAAKALRRGVDPRTGGHREYRADLLES